MTPATLMARLDRSLVPGRAAAAGALAAAVYLAEMYVDMAVTRSPSDDLLMLGLPVTRDRTRARLVGLLAHTGFGTTMGLLYAAVVRRRLHGANWLRGVQMMLAENAVLWPLTFVVDRVHPAMLDGTLPRLNRPLPFLQQIVRHIAFGITMAALYGNGRHAEREKREARP